MVRQEWLWISLLELHPLGIRPRISFASEFPFSTRRFKNDFMDQLPTRYSSTGVFRSKGLLWFTFVKANSSADCCEIWLILNAGLVKESNGGAR